MKTIEYRGNSIISMGEKNIPEPGPSEVRIRISFCGICGSDLHIAAGHHPRARAGLTLGHEFSGIIDKAGPATSFKTGDRVTAEPLISCGKCYSCKSGFPHVCAILGLYGIDADGGFAEYVIIPAEKVHLLPDSVSMEYGAMVEPMAVGVHAVRMSKLKAMDTVLVIGGGPIGFFTALAAKEAGAEVYIAEINAYRKDLLNELGFALFDMGHPDALSNRNIITDSKGFNVVFDAAGGPETLKAALDAVCIRGEVVIVAVPPGDKPFSYLPVSFKEITITGIRVYEYYDFTRAIKLLESSSLDLSKIYSVFPIESFEKAFSAAREGRDVMRVLISS